MAFWDTYYGLFASFLPRRLLVWLGFVLHITVVVVKGTCQAVGPVTVENVVGMLGERVISQKADCKGMSSAKCLPKIK